MAIESMKKISAANSELGAEYEKARKKIRKSKYVENLPIGEGAEVQIRGVLDGIKSIKDLISSMTRSYALAFSLTTTQEREEIRNAVNNLVTKLSELNGTLGLVLDKKSRIPDSNSLEFVNPQGQTQRLDFDDVFSSLEKLKVLLRPLRQFFTEERVVELEEQIQALQRRKTKIETEIASLEETSEKASAIIGHLTESQNSASEVCSALDEIKEGVDQKKEVVSQKISEAQSQLENFSEESERFEKIRNAAEEKRQAIESFFDDITQREKQLEDQEKRTDEYRNSLDRYEEENAENIRTARKIIKEAESALKLSGEVSLGRHFSNYFEDSKKGISWWLVGGAVFLLAAISLGIWAVYWNSETTAATEVFVRVSLIPLTLLGAAFCATRYVKQKRIVEDYGHKKVLALSLTSFRNQFENSEYSEAGKDFLNGVLEQIYAHPLRENLKRSVRPNIRRKQAEFSDTGANSEKDESEQ